MKKILRVCATLTLAFCAVIAFAADVTGAWSGEMVEPGGNRFHLAFTLKQDGANLAGSVIGPQGDPIEITEGKIDGDKLTFTLNVNGTIIKHEGVVIGDTIKLTTKSDSGDFPGGDITLTRVKSPGLQ
jgi:hypothetical protein